MSTKTKIQSQTIHREDYRPPQFLVDDVALKFDIRKKDYVLLTNTSHVRRNPDVEAVDDHLVLHGNPDVAGMPIIIKIDGKEWKDFYITPYGELILQHVPKAFELKIMTGLNPVTNSSFSGLYWSKEGTMATQCETLGFRNMTYALDRPDVLSTYKVTIEADKKNFPNLLSNGVKKTEEDFEDREFPGVRHRVVWEDNRPKPPYLFAMLAGDMDVLKKTYVYQPGGEELEIQVYVKKGLREKGKFALEAAERAVHHAYKRWGHKYHSIDPATGKGVFKIAAVRDFNMGAMENTDLNIFNEEMLLAHPETTTDLRYYNVDRVVAHEYFHDETGNWVIPRNWFQIAFKEGLTVFRDQNYTAETYGKDLQRITNAQDMRAIIFKKDMSSGTHPMVLDSYTPEGVMKLYDSLTYPKSAAVNRMLEAMVGVDTYTEANKSFFGSDKPSTTTIHEFFDHEANKSFFGSDKPSTTTIHEFFDHIAKASGRSDLGQFVDTWTKQYGVPTLECAGVYDAEKKEYTLTVKQRAPGNAPAGQKPFHIPVRLGLVGVDGKDIAATSEQAKLVDPEGRQHTLQIEVKDEEQTFVFKGVDKEPKAISLNRDGLTYAQMAYAKGHEPTAEQQAFLAGHDSNPFKRWDALQDLGKRVLQSVIDAKKQGTANPVVQPELIHAIRNLLIDKDLDNGMKAKMLLLPSESEMQILQPQGKADPLLIHDARNYVRQAIASQCEAELHTTYQQCQVDAPYQFVPEQIGKRALLNACLGYLGEVPEKKYSDALEAQFERNNPANPSKATSANFNDLVGALRGLLDIAPESAKEKLTALRERWKDEPPALNQLLAMQVMALGTSLEDVRALTNPEQFDHKNPNQVRSALGALMANPPLFHAKDGSGYRFFAEQMVEVAKVNPITASRTIQAAFENISLYPPEYRSKMIESISILRAGGADKDDGIRETLANAEAAHAKATATEKPKPQIAAGGSGPVSHYASAGGHAVAGHTITRA